MKLVGKRIIVRPPTARDIPAILRYLDENRAHHAPWEPKRPPAYYTAADWRRRLRRPDPNALRTFIFVGDEVIGSVNLSNIVRGAWYSCTLGYMLAKSHEGRGYMTEALRLMITHAFGPMNLHRLQAAYQINNRRSARVLKRLGFRIEGRSKRYLLINGRWRDHVITARLNPRWSA